MARELGLLREERELPLPSTFMLSVRNLATAHGIIEKMEAAPPPQDQPE
jgi:cell division protein FtsX